MKKARVFGVAVVAGVLAWAGVAVARRPVAIDDADPVDAGQFEFEAGAAYAHDPDRQHWDFPFGLRN